MDQLRLFLELANETLAAAIVIVAASMLLYNLSRNLKNRVARTSGVMLACVTLAYASDVLVSLSPRADTLESLVRLQWVGLAFMPAAMFHLSDALLATTGLPSRGRRRRVVRVLYLLGAMFLLLAAFSDSLVRPTVFDDRISLRAAPLIWLYLTYFVLSNGIAFLNVERARRRCRTRSSKRRMAYLELAILTPIMGIFPYSVFLNTGDEFSIGALILVNLANLLVAFTLLFLAYPLSFFGSQVPDRVVKAELLRFMLLGPATGVLALVVVLYTGPATEFLGVPGTDFMPFGVVMVILLWQWFVDLSLPWLEKQLVYRNEDEDQLAKLQTLSDRMLTRTDLLQLLGTILEAMCDYLRTDRAFVVSLTEQTPETVKTIGHVETVLEKLQQDALQLIQQLNGYGEDDLHWESYRVFPLYSHRTSDQNGKPTMIGLIGVEISDETHQDEDGMLPTFLGRAEQTLDDMVLQTEIYAAIEGLLPQITVTRSIVDEVEYRPGYGPPLQPVSTLNREQVIEQVHAALRHYWGGPGLSSSRLLELSIVHNALADNEDNPVRALRAVLQQAIENQRPEGERDMKSQEWTIYNILTLRFIDKRKARDTARRLFMSEANLYRKQNIAIEAVADTLIQMERAQVD